MNFQKLTGEIKRLESLTALAATKAAQGARAAKALANGSAIANLATIGPATAVALTSAAFITSASGTARVNIEAGMQVNITGSTSVAGEVVTFSLLRDGVALTGAPTFDVELSATHAVASGTLAWQVTETPGSSHTYAIQAVNKTTPAHTLEVAAGNSFVKLAESL